MYASGEDNRNRWPLRPDASDYAPRQTRRANGHEADLASAHAPHAPWMQAQAPEAQLDLPPSLKRRRRRDQRRHLRWAATFVVVPLCALGIAWGATYTNVEFSSLAKQARLIAFPQSSDNRSRGLQSLQLPQSVDPSSKTALQSNPTDTAGSRDVAVAQTAARSLSVNGPRVLEIDEPAHLSILTTNADTSLIVTIRGLVPGSLLSAGAPVTVGEWRLTAEDIRGALALSPPVGFAGAMDLAVELRLADNTVIAANDVRLEWLRKASPVISNAAVTRFSAAEVALIVKRGTDLLAAGNIGAARMMLQPAALAGNAIAAFALAETYDPAVLNAMGARGGITPDKALAQRWYERARALGAPAAPERLARLARLGR